MASQISHLLSAVRASGVTLAGGKVYFYLPGTSTLSTIWLDYHETIPAANPYTLDANGTALLYGKGLYRVVVEDASGVRRFDWDNISVLDLNSLWTGAQDALTAANTALHTAQSIIDSAPPMSALILLTYGQSNAARRAPRVTLSYPPKLVCFSGLNESLDRTDGLSVDNCVDGASFASTVPFNEFGKDAESLAPGFAAADSAYGKILTFTPARGSYHYRDLMTGSGPWTDVYNAMKIGRDKLVAGGTTHIDTVMLWDQGEADGDTQAPDYSVETPITVEKYVAVVQDLVLNANRTSKLAHRTPTYHVPILSIQPCFANSPGSRNVQTAQVSAARSVSGFYLAGPRYAFPYEDNGVHITGLGKRLIGEYCALRLADIAAGNPLPVHITSATRTGNVITAAFHTISGSLVIDTDTIPDTAAAYPGSMNGFEYYVGNTQYPVSNVVVTNNIATITLASDPGAAGELRYAQMTWAGGMGGIVTGPNSQVVRGNIRDSGARTAKHDGSTLYNWACHQAIATN